MLHRDTYTSARALKLQIFLNMGIAANKLQSADKFDHFLKICLIRGHYSLCSVSGWGCFYLNFAEDEIQFPVLLGLQTGVERTGLGEILHQLVLFSLTELSSFRLGVHPLRLIKQTHQTLELLQLPGKPIILAASALTIVNCWCRLLLTAQSAILLISNKDLAEAQS